MKTEIYVEKQFPSGALLLSAIYEGRRVKHMYFEYTKREALLDFRRRLDAAVETLAASAQGDKSWRAKDGQIYDENDPKSRTIAIIRHDADAKLMAAAPQLLEACEFALKYLEWHAKETGDAIPYDNVRTLRAAIEKARG